MKIVNGAYVADEYEGCRNCMFNGERTQNCMLAEEKKDVLRVCPFWQKEDKRGTAV